MYAAHFGLSQDPFSIAPDPRYLFMSERHREALAHLLYGVTGGTQATGGTGGGFVLLTGDIGTGKTTICRCFLAQIPPDCHVAYIFNPKLSVPELLQSICDEFHIAVAPGTSGIASVKDYIDALNAFLLQSHAAGQNSVLIIDEAQNLAADVLEQLRLLTNLETNERKLLQIVLIGQPELRELLARPELEQLAQRVIARFHLDALTPAETMQYIGHRLVVAGHSGALPFQPRALRRIHQLTGGVPRRINLLCGRALLGAWATGVASVDRQVLDKAASEVFGPGEARATSPKWPYLGYALAGLTLVAALVLPGLQLGSTPEITNPSTQDAAPLAQVAAPEAPVSATKTEAKTTLPATPVADLQSLWPHLPTDIDSAWRELASDWHLSADSADPCQTAQAQQLQCYRTSKLTMPLLRQLNRPGILTLQAVQGPAVYALLTQLNDQTATLRVAGALHRVRLVELAQVWRGDFATYWQLPPGYDQGLQQGSSGPAVQWLTSRLALLDGLQSATNDGAPMVFDTALGERVRAFQRERGITPDGLPGPMTFMQLDSATQGLVPSFLSEPR